MKIEQNRIEGERDFELLRGPLDKRYSLPLRNEHSRAGDVQVGVFHAQATG